MKKLIISLVIVGVALYVFFVVLKPAAIAPNGELTSHTPTPTATGNITVTSPTAGATVSHTFTVTGMERTFEQGVVMRVYDGTGTKILEQHTTGSGSDAGVFGPYSFTVAIPANITGAIELWVFDYSAKDGSVIELVKVPLTVK